jgi:hypothetical protein
VGRINVLEMEWRRSPSHPEVVAAEFVIDGRTLLEHCAGAARSSFDLVSPIGWTSEPIQLEFAKRLLLELPSELPTGRRAFLVCSECGDLGCGCISAVVERREENFVWSAFGHENNHDPQSLQLFPMGDFTVPVAIVTRLLFGRIAGLSAKLLGSLE